MSYIYVFFFFFFQAEDGIRDKLVTGVQTCALPISRSGCVAAATHPERVHVGSRDLDSPPGCLEGETIGRTAHNHALAVPDSSVVDAHELATPETCESEARALRGAGCVGLLGPRALAGEGDESHHRNGDRKSTRLDSSH